jgi:hypothetical protein
MASGNGGARFTFGEPRTVPAGWPPDVAPRDLITAAHINTVKASVYQWPGAVNGGGFALVNTGNISIGMGGTGFRIQSFGAGQNSNYYSQAGPHTGAFLIQDSGLVVGNGGALLMGAGYGAGYFAGIKGYGVSGADQSVGDLLFVIRQATTQTQLSEVMRVTYQGNVGIGISNPAEKLAVNGNVSATGNISATGNVSTGDLNIANTSGSPGVTFRLDGFSDSLYFVADGAGQLLFRTNGVERFWLAGDGVVRMWLGGSLKTLSVDGSGFVKAA